MAEAEVGEVEDRSIELFSLKQQKQSLADLWDNIKGTNKYAIRVSEQKERKNLAEKYLNNIPKFPKCQTAYQLLGLKNSANSSRMSTKETIPRYIMVK